MEKFDFQPLILATVALMALVHCPSANGHRGLTMTLIGQLVVPVSTVELVLIPITKDNKMVSVYSK